MSSNCLSVSDGRALRWQSTNRTERADLVTIKQISSAGNLSILDIGIYQRFIFIIIFFFHPKHDSNLIQNIWKAIDKC